MDNWLPTFSENQLFYGFRDFAASTPVATKRGIRASSKIAGTARSSSSIIASVYEFVSIVSGQGNFRYQPTGARAEHFHKSTTSAGRMSFCAFATRIRERPVVRGVRPKNPRAVVMADFDNRHPLISFETSCNRFSQWTKTGGILSGSSWRV